MKRWRLILAFYVAVIGMAYAMSRPLRTSAREEAPVVKITAKRFEFSPNQITLKKGQTVKLDLTSEDVQHGFFQKELGIDADIFPGRITEVTITPQAAGSFTTQCDHFCGAGHGRMRMTIQVTE